MYIYLFIIWALSNFGKVTFIVLMSLTLHPSVVMKRLYFHWSNFHKIFYISTVFCKIDEKKLLIKITL